MWPLLLRPREENAAAAPAAPPPKVRRPKSKEPVPPDEELKNARWTGVISATRAINVALPAPVLILDDLAVAEAQIKRKRAKSDSDTFLFDPKAFQEANKNARLEQYQLSDDQLRDWAARVTKLRREI